MTNRYLNKRNLLGSLLFLILVGEVNVGFANGLFTPPGLVVLSLLYFIYFIFLDSVVYAKKLNNLGVVLVNFAFYSVLITGLFHGELSDPVTHPDRTLITILIRLQCSLYPIFAYWILKKLSPRVHPAPPVRTTALWFFGYFLILSPTHTIGFTKLLDTIQTAPAWCVLFIGLAFAALAKGLTCRTTTTNTAKSRQFGIVTIILLVISLIPGILFFMLLLLTMLITGLVYLAKPWFRKQRFAD